MNVSENEMILFTVNMKNSRAVTVTVMLQLDLDFCPRVYHTFESVVQSVTSVLHLKLFLCQSAGFY